MGASVLIVDDSNAMRGMVKTLLAREGLFERYYEASDGLEALEVLGSGAPVDLALMDMFMPGLDGFGVIRRLRASPQWKDLPVLALSVDGGGGAKARGLEAGASDYLAKPFDRAELAARIRLLLRRKRLQDELARKNRELAEVNRELRKLAVTDGLTSLFNRAYFMERMSVEMKRCRRYGMDMSVLLIDIDDFKLINDTFGHLAGDEVLRGVSAMFRQCVRDSDAVGRYGGEEFIACLTHTDMDGASVVAERIRASAEAMSFEFARGACAATTSIGMTQYSGGAGVEVDDLVGEADSALYRAKAAGKNTVVAYRA